MWSVDGSWTCVRSDDSRCVISWTFILWDVEVLLWTLLGAFVLARLLTSPTLIRMICPCFWRTGGASGGETAGNLAAMFDPHYKLRALKRRHPRAMLILTLIFQVAPSFFTCYLFILRAVKRRVDVGEILLAEIVCNAVFTAVWLARLVSSPKMKTVFSMQSFVDMISVGSFGVLLFSSCDWLPSTTGGFDDLPGSDCTDASTGVQAKTWFSFAYLRALYMGDLFDIVEALSSPNAEDVDDNGARQLGGGQASKGGWLMEKKPPSPLKHNMPFQVMRFLLKVAAVIFVTACTMYALEWLGEIPFSSDYTFMHLYQCSDGSIVPTMSTDCSNEVFSLFASLYFVVVTLGTVGYGDFAPTTFPSRLFIMMAILIGIVIFAQWATGLLDISRLSRRGKGQYDPDISGRHVVITGAPCASQIRDFLTELFHDAHAPLNTVQAVFLLDPELSKAGEADQVNVSAKDFILNEASAFPWGDQLRYLEGSALNPYDLQRAAVERADAVFILPNRFDADGESQDQSSLMRVLAIRRYLSTATVSKSPFYRGLRIAWRTLIFVITVSYIILLSGLSWCGRTCRAACSCTRQIYACCGIVPSLPASDAPAPDVMLQAGDLSSITTLDGAYLRINVGMTKAVKHARNRAAHRRTGTVTDAEEMVRQVQRGLVPGQGNVRRLAFSGKKSIASRSIPVSRAPSFRTPTAGTPTTATAPPVPPTTRSAQRGCCYCGWQVNWLRDNFREIIGEEVVPLPPSEAVLVVLMLRHAQHKAFAVSAGISIENIVACEELDYALLGLSSMCKGASTFVSNLIVSQSAPVANMPPPNVAELLRDRDGCLTPGVAMNAAWQAEYLLGCTRSIVSLHLSRRYIGSSFRDIARGIFRDSAGSVTLVGMTVPQPDGSRRLILAPPPNALYFPGASCYAIAASELAVAKYTDIADEEMYGPADETGDEALFEQFLDTMRSFVATAHNELIIPVRGTPVPEAWDGTLMRSESRSNTAKKPSAAAENPVATAVSPPPLPLHPPLVAASNNNTHAKTTSAATSDAVLESTPHRLRHQGDSATPSALADVANRTMTKAAASELRLALRTATMSEASAHGKSASSGQSQASAPPRAPVHDTHVPITARLAEMPTRKSSAALVRAVREFKHQAHQQRRKSVAGAHASVPKQEPLTVPETSRSADDGNMHAFTTHRMHVERMFNEMLRERITSRKSIQEPPASLLRRGGHIVVLCHSGISFASLGSLLDPLRNASAVWSAPGRKRRGGRRQGIHVVILHPGTPTLSEWAQLQPKLHAESQGHATYAVLPSDDRSAPNSPAFGVVQFEGAGLELSNLSAGRKSSPCTGTGEHVTDLSARYALNEQTRLRKITRRNTDRFNTTPGEVFLVSGTPLNFHDLSRCGVITAKRVIILSDSSGSEKFAKAWSQSQAGGLAHDSSALYTFALLRSKLGDLQPPTIVELASMSSLTFLNTTTSTLMRNHPSKVPLSPVDRMTDMVLAAVGARAAPAPHPGQSQADAGRAVIVGVMQGSALASAMLLEVTGASSLYLQCPSIISFLCASKSVQRSIESMFQLDGSSGWPPGNLSLQPAPAGSMTPAKEYIVPKSMWQEDSGYEENGAISVIPEFAQGTAYSSSVCESLLAGSFYEPHATEVFRSLLVSKHTQLVLIKVPPQFLLAEVSLPIENTASGKAAPARQLCLTAGLARYGDMFDYFLNVMGAVPVGVMRNAARMHVADVVQLLRATARTVEATYLSAVVGMGSASDADDDDGGADAGSVIETQKSTGVEMETPAVPQKRKSVHARAGVQLVDSETLFALHEYYKYRWPPAAMDVWNAFLENRRPEGLPSSAQPAPAISLMHERLSVEEVTELANRMQQTRNMDRIPPLLPMNYVVTAPDADTRVKLDDMILAIVSNVSLEACAAVALQRWYRSLQTPRPGVQVKEASSASLPMGSARSASPLSSRYT